MNETVIGAPSRAPLLHLADRALNRPLLLHPDKAAVILDVLAGRISVDSSAAPPLTPEASRFFGSAKREDGSYRMSPASGGVAVISIVGSLVNRGAWIGASSGLVSYEGIAAQLRDAASDASVHSIILDIDTGGGEAGGITGLVAEIVEARKSKYVVAVVNDAAASGGYWIASACDEIVISETGMVGSIGVVVVHVNRSGELQQKGWQPTFIFAGSHKVDGNSMGPLPDEVRADVQASVDDLYDRFLAGVAAGRGSRLTAEAARATEARVFYGQAAIDAGLADRIGTFAGTLADLQTRRATTAFPQKRKEKRMSAENENTVTLADHTSAVASARAEGATAERGRISAILTCDAAKERPELAKKMAFDTDMSAEAAAAFMASLPAEKPVSSIPSMDERAASAGPGFGAELPGGAETHGQQMNPGADVMKKAAAKINQRRAR